MSVLRTFLCFNVAVVQITGAHIEILTEGNAVECGKNFTLTCNIEENSSSIVAWMHENNVKHIASCVRDSCNLNRDFVDEYIFTYDTVHGVYNLTILNLTMTDIGRKFVCSNGYHSVSTTVSLDEYKALLFEDTQNAVVTATSGCIFPETNVVIKWMKIDAVDNKESEFNPLLLHTNTNICLNVSVCSTNQQVHHLVSISAKSSDNGKYFLKITVAYENEIIKSNITTLKYNVEEQGYTKNDDADNWKINQIASVFLFGACMSFTCFLAAVIGSICKRFWLKDSDKSSDRKNDTNKDKRNSSIGTVLDNKQAHRRTWPG